MMAGPGKLLPFHPMYKEMEPGFRAGMGPFFGLPGAPLRILIGVANTCAGWGLLVALWMPHTMIKTLPLAPASEMVELSQVLLLCASVGLITISLGAAWYHIALEGSPGPMTVFLPIHCIILGCRLQVTPLGNFDNKKFAAAAIFSSFPPNTMFERFIVVCAIALVLAIVMRITCGKATNDVKADMEAAKTRAIFDK